MIQGFEFCRNTLLYPCLAQMLLDLGQHYASLFAEYVGTLQTVLRHTLVMEADTGVFMFPISVVIFHSTEHHPVPTKKQHPISREIDAPIKSPSIPSLPIPSWLLSPAARGHCVIMLVILSWLSYEWKWMTYRVWTSTSVTGL